MPNNDDDPKPADDKKEPDKDPNKDSSQKQPEDKTEPSSQVKAGFHDSEVKKAYIADKQEFNESRKYIFGTDQVKRFSIRHTRKVGEEEEREVSYYYQPDEETISELRATLDQKRLLVLTGEPRQGKTATAIYLSHLLRFEQSETLSESLITHPLDQTVRIEFSNIIENKKKFGGRMLVFRDALARKNRDIREFFIQLDKDSIKGVSERLRNNNMFLLFTSDTEAIDKDCRSRLSDIKLIRQLPMMSDEQLKRGLKLKLEQFAISKRIDIEQVNSVLSEDQQKFLIAKLRTMPQIADFIDDYLLMVKDGLNIAEAINRFENIQDWFLRELAGDFEVWCFAFTLSLCQCVQDSAGIPWFVIEGFRRIFTRCLRREFNLQDQGKLDFKERLLYFQNNLSEETLVERCRAEIFENPDTGAHSVRFADDRYPEMLWKSFLKSNRKLFTPILGYLKKEAEVDNPAIRCRAAQILGRIGEVDPFGITFSLMHDWMRSGNYQQMATVGYLYEGIISSQNERYKKDLLRELDVIASGDDKSELWTAIAAYKRIGVFNLSLAMQKYREITERKLVESMNDTKRIDTIFKRVEKALDQADPNTVEHFILTNYKEELSDIARRIYDKDIPFLWAIQHAVVSLCIECGLIPVLEEFSKWIEPDQKALNYVFTLIFLMDGGIADELGRRSVEIAAADEASDLQPQECSLFVFSIASDENSIRRTAGFLEAVFEGFSDFLPLQYQRFMREIFFLQIRKLVNDALPVKKCREAIEQLCAMLLTSRNEELRTRLSGYISSHHFANRDKHQDKPLYEFARATLGREMEIRSKSF